MLNIIKLYVYFLGVAAFLVNFSGFLVMGNISALAHVLLGQFKTAAVCLGGVVLFGSVYPPAQLYSAAGAVACIIAYTHVTMTKLTMTMR
jgi:hypothetical protein